MVGALNSDLPLFVLPLCYSVFPCVPLGEPGINGKLHSLPNTLLKGNLGKSTYSQRLNSPILVISTSVNLSVHSKTVEVFLNIYGENACVIDEFL